MEKLIIEARINEYTMRDQNPNVPWTADEIAGDAAECREAGAAILHFHARQADGSPDFTYEAVRDVVLASRDSCDMLIHPTLGYGRLDAGAEERMDNIIRLAADARTRPDFAPMDMGSTNVDWYDPEGHRYLTKGLIYSNGTDVLEYFAETIRHHGITPYLTAWNIGFTRQIGAFLDMGLLRAPAYVCFSLT
ncbi:MAG: 3-keto-5-aminohexanoate cleavage protein, partial [Rhizobiaceae bacterium]